MSDAPPAQTTAPAVLTPAQTFKRALLENFLLGDLQRRGLAVSAERVTHLRHQWRLGLSELGPVLARQALYEAALYWARMVGACGFCGVAAHADGPMACPTLPVTGGMDA
jgi:hypothetical protein